MSPPTATDHDGTATARTQLLLAAGEEKVNMRQRSPMLRSVVPTLLLLSSVVAPHGAEALERPTPAQIEQYRKDGSLATRVERARQIGNHQVDPQLVAGLNYRLRLQQWKEGLLDVQPTPPPSWRGMPTKGNVRILALLISFSDYAPSNTPASIDGKLFGDGLPADYPRESVRNYYRRASYNQLELQGATLGWYAAPYPRSSVPQTTAGREALIKEALASFNAAGHDFSQYDNDGDGAIDYFVVVWTGPDNGWANFWWGYQTSFSDSSYLIDGKRLGKYSWQWETLPLGGTFSPYVVIHETGHALGLPDYYDYDDTVGPRGGLGGLDMMDANWGDHNCFSKSLLDWMTPTVVAGGTNAVSLRPSGSYGEAVLFAKGATSDPFAEYFMVQNRTRVANDTGYPADGLLIWHLDARLNASATSFLYNNSSTDHKLIRLMEADGLEEIESGNGANAGDYYVSGRTLGPVTRPSSAKYDGTPTSMRVVGISAPGDPMTAHVDEIVDASGPTGVPGTPTDAGVTTMRDRATFHWTQGTASDPESGIAGYHLQVGTAPGGADVFDGLVGNVLVWTVSNLLDGRTYYARVRALNGAGVATGWSASSDGITTAFVAFPCAALDNCALAFKTGGDAPWFEQSSVAHYGSSAGQSGAIGDDQTSFVQTTLTGPGTLSFWWQVFSEPYGDEFGVYVDGALALSKASGWFDWTQRQVSIGVGVHTVKWAYVKNASLAANGDVARLDRVEWFPSTSLGGIAGRVTAAAGGAPLAGVTVSIYDGSNSWVASTDTGATGDYTSPGLTPGAYYALTANSLGYINELYDNIPCVGYCSPVSGTPIAVASGTTATGRDFALVTGGRITGTVTAAASGAPLSDVEVALYDSNGSYVTYAFTGASGAYAVTGLPAGSYKVLTYNWLGYVDELYDDVTCPGASCSFASGTPVVVTLGGTTGGIDFALVPGGRIAGTITDASTGSPLGDAVYVNVYDASGAYEGHGYSSGASYVTSGLPAGTYYVRTSNSLGYVDELYDNIPCTGSCTVTAGSPLTVTAGATHSGVNFALVAGGRISGTVTNAATAAPLSSVSVYVYTAAGNYVAGSSTNAAGAYSIGGLLAGSYYLRTNNSLGYVDELYDNIACPGGSCSLAAGTAVAVASGATVGGVNFGLSLGGRIGGTVTSSPGGAPIANISVNVYDSAGHSSGRGYTNASGVYLTGGLPPGSYRVVTYNTLGYLDELYDNVPCTGGSCDVTTGTAIAVSPGATTGGVNFALAQGGRISGLVTDATSGDPLPNVQVSVYAWTGLYAAWKGYGYTNASGAYITATGLDPGTYYAVTDNSLGYVDELYDNLPCPGSSCQLTLGAPITVAAAATTTGISFALARGGQIGGTVTDATTGAPLSSVSVIFYGSSGRQMGNGYTNAAGVYASSGLPPGNYTAVTWNSAGYVDELYDNVPCPHNSCNVSAGKPITVTVGSSATASFALARGGRISGTVTAAGTGAALPNVFVSIRDASDSEVSSGYTNASGAYTTDEAVPPGSYRAATMNWTGRVDELYDNLPCPGGECATAGGTPISVTAGATTAGIDFALAAGGTISGTVTDASTAAPLAGVRVRVYSLAGAPMGSGFTSSSGTYETVGLPAGSYRVRTSSSLGYVDELYDDIPCPGGACSLDAGATVAVTVGSTSAGVDFALARVPSSSFYTLLPCRALDSRLATDPFAGQPLHAGEERALTLAGTCAIPPTARAVSFNLTVTGGTVGGHLRLYPAGAPRPLVSAINFTAGQTRANNGVAGLSTAGAVTIYCGQPTGSGGTVHVILDVNGYFE